ncbi:hypothetical protein KAR91_83395 [Candidatus Pacearchaeota archaeon]|nr:hypothetical protein [Candidatus Pacearchaeota archaeon]
MISKDSEAINYKCPLSGFNDCLGRKCMVWKWEVDKNIYYGSWLPDYAPTDPIIESDLTISFRKGASSERDNRGEAKGTCGLIK